MPGEKTSFSLMIIIFSNLSRMFWFGLVPMLTMMWFNYAMGGISSPYLMNYVKPICTICMSLQLR